jgi:hypothetical protein
MVDERRAAPQEPILDLDEIQGNTVPGFLKPHQTGRRPAVGKSSLPCDFEAGC